MESKKHVRGGTRVCEEPGLRGRVGKEWDKAVRVLYLVRCKTGVWM